MSGKILHLPQQVEMPASERPVAPLVGRDMELAVLHQRLEFALQGQRQVVLLAGEPGIGKTALADAFLTQLQKRTDVRTTSGQCVELYGSGEAYMPLLEATIQLCRGPGREQSIETLKRYAPSWLAQLPGLLEPQAFGQLQQRVQGTSRERMLREMAEAAELFTTTRALVLVLEDLHWSDVSTLDWVSYMARRREPAKLLILGTYRPVDVLANNHPLHGVVQELQARQQCEELRLTPLAEEAIGEYLTVRFKADVGAQRAASLQQLTPVLHRRTGGNPLFIVNTVDDLIRQGMLAEDAGEWILRTDTAEALCESVPNSLRQLIDRQLERLPGPEQRLLEVASVVGVEFAAAEVTAGLPTDSEEVEAQCERLARTGQWVREIGIAEWPDGTLSGRYSFRHALYHEVVYAQSAEVRRVQLHRRIAERKEAAYGEQVGEIAAELAVHFEKGRALTRAVHYLGKAGETAMRRNAHQEAIAHFTRGLELLATFPDTPERKQQELMLQGVLGVPLVRTKGYAAPEVARAYGRARELCQEIGEQPELFRALIGLCSFYLVRAELQTARELAEQCLRLAQHAQEPALLMVAHSTLGMTLFYCGELTAAQAILEYGSTIYDAQAHNSLMLRYGQDPGVACRGYASLTRWLLGYPEQALGKSYDTLSLARELSHPFSVGVALLTASWLRQYRQEEQASQEYAEEQIVLSQEEGFALWLAVGTIQRGWALSEQGDEEQGLAQMRGGLPAFTATGAALAHPYHLALLAQAHGKNGQPHEGLALLDQALARVDNTGERYYEAELYRLKGELTLQQEFKVQVSKFQVDNPQSAIRNPQSEAEACFLQALEIARSQEAKSLELRAAMSLARLWQQQNKVDKARELLEKIYVWFTEGFDTKDLQEAAALLRSLGSEKESQKSKSKSQKSEQAEGLRLKAEGPPLSSPSSLQPTASSLSQSSVLSPQSLSSPAPNTFHPEGEYWTVSFAGVTCCLKEARGLHYIAHLLQQPHQEVHVTTLLTVGADLSAGAAETHPFQDTSLPFDHSDGFSDAGEILDPQARAAYKQRLSELREELAEAQQFHDLGRSEQLAAELDFITRELTRAVGLGGRARRVGSPAERARVNVTRAIKIALRKIGEHHPALGQHLATTIKTGVYCSYTPDVRLPITWQN